jgi:hypothetical protein
MEEEQIYDNPFDHENVVSQNFAAKFGTKGEVWRFMATEARVYLPPY